MLLAIADAATTAQDADIDVRTWPDGWGMKVGNGSTHFVQRGMMVEQWTSRGSTAAWRRLRAQVVREEPVCTLQYPGICTRISTTADHKIPRSERPDLSMVRSNLQGACRPCNNKRGNGPLPPSAEPPIALSWFG